MSAAEDIEPSVLQVRARHLVLALFPNRAKTVLAFF